MPHQLAQSYLRRRPGFLAVKTAAIVSSIPVRVNVRRISSSAREYFGRGCRRNIPITLKTPEVRRAKGGSREGDAMPLYDTRDLASGVRKVDSNHYSYLYFCGRLADKRCARSVCPLRCRRSIRSFMSSGLFLPYAAAVSAVKSASDTLPMWKYESQSM